MFIAYLEDRGITNSEYFRSATGQSVESFWDLLTSKKPRLLGLLFDGLREDFNGDLFVAPCSFESATAPPDLTETHLNILARFRSGREEMGSGGGQYRFWGYDFRYIPVELISAVYDRFLGEREEERRAQGAYYTPMYLADTVVSQVWSLLSTKVKDGGRFLDPACGSGVFLVRSFQRLCEQWRANHRSNTIPWNSLQKILSRLNGWDLNGGAVRVAVFSLYIALLEEVSPPDIRRLLNQGKILPQLWNKNLIACDFFEPTRDAERFDVIIGNPPWTSRRGPDRSSVRWSASHNTPMPGKEIAWAFTWKALRHISKNGIISFLLPAMGFLHNNAGNTVRARRRLFCDGRIWRLVNFADLRFQLFDGATSPAALFVFSKNEAPESPYEFDYWAPKADLNLRLKRLITLSSADKMILSSKSVSADTLTFKRRLWMREPDAKLFSYLSSFGTIGDRVSAYRTVGKDNQDDHDNWVIGQGFQPVTDSDTANQSVGHPTSQLVGKLPYLPIEHFSVLAQDSRDLSPWHSNTVRRRGFEEGFVGSRILIPRGISTAQYRLRASYVEEPITFRHIIQAIRVPSRDSDSARLLTALLNSRVMIWFAFHGTDSFGSERPEVKQAELLRLPFPASPDLPEPRRALRAKEQLVEVIRNAVEVRHSPFTLAGDGDSLLQKIDQLAYDYFCLSTDEIMIIEDTVEQIIPAVQPSRGAFPELWKPSKADERREYAKWLVGSLSEWFDNKSVIHARLEASNSDLAILRLTVDNSKADTSYSERGDISVNASLAEISRHLGRPLGGNFQLMPDFRVFADRHLYLIKPLQKRFWLRSAALADADAIASDLQDNLFLDGKRSHA